MLIKTDISKKILAKSILFASIFAIQLSSCNSSGDLDHLGFTQIISSELEDYNFDNDKLANPEMMFANDSILVVHDYQNNKLFSTFDLRDGTLKKRFGEIGRGENEILLGTVGYLHDSSYMTYDVQTNKIVNYNPNEGDSSFSKIGISIPEGVGVSRVYIPNDTTALIMGCYNGKYKYIKCVNNIVTDSLILISNSDDPGLNNSQRFLSEQGEITISPDGNKFAATTNYSDNIDFIRIGDKGLETIKLNHNRDATFTPETLGSNMFRMIPSDKDPIGFIRISSNKNNVYALYADHTLRDGDYCSHYVLVYDWLGHPQKALKLSEPAYCIAVNETHLFAAVTDENGVFKIKALELDGLI